MIQAEGLTKFYGSVPAIENVSFSVERGEIMGFLGPNAAGKTTTMRILTGYMPATRGRARVAGYDVAADPIEVKRRVGYCPENVPLYPEMVVAAFLNYVADVKGVGRSELPGEVGRVMEHCGLTHMARRPIRNLSKGYRQRVGLAQALIGSPPVLILDEPTVGLDPSQIIEIRQMIQDLAQQHTILLSSHILPEVAMVCDRVLVIHQGRIVAADTVRGLADQGSRMTLEIVASGSPHRARKLVQEVSGVRETALAPDGVIVARCDTDDDPRARIIHALSGAGLALQELRVRRRSLEDVFVEAISADGAEQGAAPVLTQPGGGDES